MKKAFILLFFLLILGAAGLAPWLEGYYLKNCFDDAFLVLNNIKGIKVIPVEYHNNWLSSDATVKIIITDEKHPNISLESTIHSHIIHGPLIYNPQTDQFDIAIGRIISTINLPEHIQAKYLPQPNNGFSQIVSTLYFNHVLINELTSSIVSHTFADGTKISWLGIYGHYKIQTDKSFTTFKPVLVQGNVTIGAVTTPVIGSNGISIISLPITLQYQYDKQTSELWSGQSNMSIPNISVKLPNGNNFELAKLHINYENGSSNTLYNINQHFSLDKLIIPNSTLPTISPANINITVNNLSEKGLQEFIDFSNSSAANTMTPEEFKQKSLALMLGVLTPTTAITSDANIQTSLGAFVLTGKIMWPQLKNKTIDEIKNNTQLQINTRVAIPLATKFVELYFIGAQTRSQQAAARSTPATATTDATANAAASAVAAATKPQPSPLEQAKAAINAWIKAGYLKQDQNDYVIDIQSDGPSLKINGTASSTTSTATPPATNG